MLTRFILVTEAYFKLLTEEEILLTAVVGKVNDRMDQVGLDLDAQIMSSEISFFLSLGSAFLHVGLILKQAFSIWWELWSSAWVLCGWYSFPSQIREPSFLAPICKKCLGGTLIVCCVDQTWWTEDDWLSLNRIGSGT